MLTRPSLVCAADSRGRVSGESVLSADMDAMYQGQLTFRIYGIGRVRAICWHALMGMGLLLAGCVQPRDGTIAQLPGERIESQRMVVGRSVNGAPIEVEVFGGGERTVLLIARMHGNEPAGTPLLHHLGGELRKNPELACGRRVLVMPLANPDGADKRQRGNAHGVDLNRNFPLDPSSPTASADMSRASRRPAPLSEPESRAIRDLILQFVPERILTLHQAADCVDYDGPPEAERIAAAIAPLGGLPLRKMGARTGSLGSYAGHTLGISVITVELPAYASSLAPAALWDRYGKMLLKGICWPD